MIKKILLGTGALATGAVLAFAFIAGAQTSSSTVSGTATPHAQPMLLQVGAAGKVLLRGKIDSVSSGSLTVKSWGGDWTVNVSSATQVMPGGDISKFSTGDFVGVQGTVSQSGSWTIDARLVRDWTYRKTITQEQHQNQQSVHNLITSGTPRNYEGTASGVGASSFTLTASGGASYTVNVVSGTKILNRNWLSLSSLSDIRSGDAVRVWGTNASGTIAASIVRDTSLPAAH